MEKSAFFVFESSVLFFEMKKFSSLLRNEKDYFAVAVSRRLFIFFLTYK